MSETSFTFLVFGATTAWLCAWCGVGIARIRQIRAETRQRAIEHRILKAGMEEALCTQKALLAAMLGQIKNRNDEGEEWKDT